MSYRDYDDYLWLEEYPEPGTPLHVLNRFVIGLWGPYKYWLETGSECARRLIEAALTTLKDHAMEYRNTGGLSWYGFTVQHEVPRHYHRMQILQMRKLAALSGSSEFDRVADAFYQDVPMEWDNCETLHCNQ